MIKLGFIVPDSGHQSRGIGAYSKNLLEWLGKTEEVIVEQVSSFSEVSEEMDLVHAPFFDLFFNTLPRKLVKPTVLTIHDVIPLVFPKQYPAGIRGKFRFLAQKRALKNIAAVITDSNCSKKDIIKYLSVPDEKVHPILLAPSRDFFVIKEEEILSRIKTKYNLPEQFAIFSGSTNWNKNINNLTQASLFAGLDIVLIGKSFEKGGQDLNHPELRSYKEFLEKFELHPKVHILGYVPTEDLVPILNLATVALLPSHYEGFGLPILEAQACGVPVIAGGNSSMIEVASDSALLVDSEKVEEIAEAIKNLATHSGTRKHLIKLGFKNVRRYSWEKSAKETLEVYKSVLTK